MDAVLSLLTVASEPPWDSILFSVLTTAYVLFLVQFYYRTPKDSNPKIYEMRPAFLRYVRGAAIVGLLLPLAHLVGGSFIGGGRHSIQAWWREGPHLYLLMAQVLSEMFSAHLKWTSPIFMVVPPLYNARRMFTLYQWMLDEKSYFSTVRIDSTIELYWLYMGQVLAVLNFILWAYNLFLFLIPIAIPDYLRFHFALYPDWPRSQVMTLTEESQRLLDSVAKFKAEPGSEDRKDK